MILSSDQLKVLQGILGADPLCPGQAMNLSGRIQTAPNDPDMRALQQQGAVMCLQAAKPGSPFDIWLATEAGIQEVRRSLGSA